MRLTRNKILSAAIAGAGFVALNLAPLPAMADGSIVVRNFVLSHGIHDREPVSDTETFNVGDGKAFAFARIQNHGDPTVVSFVWERDDETHATVPVSVGASPGWRTWSTANLQSGNWRVKLVDAQGEVLLEKSFMVQPSSYSSEYSSSNSTGGNVAMPASGMQNEVGDADDIPASVTFPMR
jgi:hypothetical protein